ncbi:MAG: hypothetical protein R2715_08740 [Ilumatobacteraceae bacterium]
MLFQFPLPHELVGRQGQAVLLDLLGESTGSGRTIGDRLGVRSMNSSRTLGSQGLERRPQQLARIVARRQLGQRVDPSVP